MDKSFRAPGAAGTGARRFGAPRIIKPLVLGLVLAGLAACEDSEERAERYYQSALALVEEQDVDRAMIELRNVFDHDGEHREARELYAELLLDRGRVDDAYSHYLRLVEQYPDIVEARRILAELALESGDWEEVRRHGEAAIALAPGAPESHALEAALDYRKAEITGDTPAQAKASDEARELVEADADLMVARRIVIDWLVQSPDPSQALPHLDAAIERDPDSRQLRMARLAVLDGEGRSEAVGEELRAMYELFPKDEQIADYLISWYVRTGDAEGAETFLRGEAGPVDGAPAGHLAVVDLLRREDGPGAALEELQRLAEANQGTDLGRLYATRAAEQRFDIAEDEAEREAIAAETQEIVAAAEGPERRLDAKMSLAQMRRALGDPEAATALVDEVLEEDRRRVEALKMRARQRLDADEVSAAVSDLRLALDGAPRDPDILTLLAEAQRKSGNVDLAGQRLAEAVEVSGSGVPEALAYARFLVERDQLSSAESVLRNAADAHPGALDVQRMLGQVLLQRGRFGAVRELAAGLDRIDSDAARRLAASLRAASLFRENRVDESLALLEERAGGDEAEGEGNLAATMQLISMQVRSERFEAAQETVAGLAERFPDSRWVDVLEADIRATQGDTEAAVETYRAVLEDEPEALAVRERLLRILREQGRNDEADTLLAESLEVLPGARSLRLREAARLERAEDYAAAISVYEGLYEENRDDVVAANNLASLLSRHGQGEDALDRAWRIAQRLNGTDQPALLDTLGWIQLRRGNVDRALRNLEAAARGLPDNATVAFDLGMAYAEAGRASDARAEIERGLELAGDRQVAQRARAEETLAALGG